MSEERKVDDRFTLWQRNVRDKYKDIPTEEIKKELQTTALPCSILMSNINGDFNFSSLIRSANNFNLKTVYYYGKKKYDKRGALGTFNYTEVVYLPSINDVAALRHDYRFVAIENNINKPVQSLLDYKWSNKSLIIIGEENSGIIPDILDLCDDFVEIISRGSVRSLNAATAASIAMYDYCLEWLPFPCPLGM